MKVDAKRTELTCEQVYDAFLRARPMPREGALLLVAHSVLETGWWKAGCYNWNLGNTKWVTGMDGDYCERECGEELPLSRVPQDPLIVVVREYERNGKPYASVLVKAGHPWSRFQAFPSLEIAVAKHVELLVTRYSGAFEAAMTGDARAYAKALAEYRYYTADPDKYALSLKMVLGEVEKKMAIWSFEFRDGESVRDRVVRCCYELLRGGPIGHGLQHATYKKFINCDMNPAGQLGGEFVTDISGWTTSCAMFVRAVHKWCGKPTEIARNGVGIFSYLQAHTGHEAWVPATTAHPKPGDVFYVASSSTANDGHVGVYLREIEPGVWETAEGGGSAAGAKSGTSCSLNKRTMGPKFDSWRRLIGIFDVEKMGLPESPMPAVMDMAGEAIVPPIAAEVDHPIPPEAPTSPQTPAALEAAHGSATQAKLGGAALLAGLAAIHTQHLLAIGFLVILVALLIVWERRRG